MTGKILKGIAGFYYVHDGRGKVYECRAKGIFRNKKIKPLVGDNVEIDIISEEEGTGNITSILPRTSSLIRPAVANADQALVVFAVTDPAPNLNLLDRFLVMMERQSLPVEICFNKSDLASEEEMERLRAMYEGAGYGVHLVSVHESQGLEEIRKLIRGKTTVLAGPSGVGKSSLTNFLHPDRFHQREDPAGKAHHPPFGALLHRGGHLHDGHPWLFLHVYGGHGAGGVKGLLSRVCQARGGLPLPGLRPCGREGLRRQGGRGSRNHR